MVGYSSTMKPSARNIVSSNMKRTMMSDNTIFVFGSNEAGRHGLGAALTAYQKHGAVRGVGYGHRGNSFALPTKDRYLQTLPLVNINDYVIRFLNYAHDNPDLLFKVTRVGCGLAGLQDDQIAPMFVGGQDNLLYDLAWKDYLTDDSKFWGTF